ncbi:MAG: c-type cytochrome [Verrucomicrobiales bacterium]|nr:c-type cytochrome [Verrucomicrobiales bacterium]
MKSFYPLKSYLLLLLVLFSPVVLRAQDKGALPAKNLSLLPGFKAELIYTVPKEEQGSWVVLTKDDKGRLYASDQKDKGLYRITVTQSAGGSKATVEKVLVDLSGAMGLKWAFGGLYVHVGGKGLFKLTDSNGDDRLDKIDQQPGAVGGGEHGNHAVELTEDGKQLYVIAGNHTNLMEDYTSRVQSWDEDLLLPRQWDARGHARGRKAPGGWVTRYDTNKRTYEVYTIGFRNEYDIALNRNGDLFTYDADMEWDMGMPWYRPTRINQVVSGADYGWRSGSGKWPNYYEDSLPPVVEIGPGSPTGLTAGTGAKFPAKYQDAIFGLDWTFGTIYAIHLQADGAGYKGTKEVFVAGAPLPVTDAVIGDDGAMYFTIGGRGAQSALYRVTYNGDESTEASGSKPDAHSSLAQTLRRNLEAYHGKKVSYAVDEAWPHLGSKDRFIRNAARVAIESQPVSEWRGKVISEKIPQIKITGAVALARSGEAADREPLVKSLLELEPTGLEKGQLLGLLRAYALTFIRLGKPDEGERQKLIAELDPLLPSKDGDVNTELIRVLVYLDAPSVAGKAMALINHPSKPEVPEWGDLIKRNASYGGTIAKMLENPAPLREMNYAFMLRNLRHGWTIEQRKQYFTFLNGVAKNYQGGASFPGFLENIREEALGNCSDVERKAVASITGENFNPVPDFEIKPAKGPGKVWDQGAAVAATRGGHLRKSDFESGRNLFHAIGCAACHRFDGMGGAIGPDLTSVRNKFDVPYMIESIIEPSKVISDQYGSSVVTLKNGEVLSGLVVEDGDVLTVYSADVKAEGKKVKRGEVVSIKESEISQMPPSLINMLNPQELADLMGYLMSGGNRKAKVYK